MNNFIKQVIEEKFESKKQQRFFYAKSEDETLPKKMKKKWGKWAKEFSAKTNFKKLPNEVKEENENSEKKKVHSLKKGDIMSGTNSEVTWVGKTIKTPKGKTRVDLKHPNGKEVTVHWGTHTEVGIKKSKQKDVDEIVDTKGNIIKGKKPTDLNTRGVTSNSTSDEVASTAMGQMGQGTLGAGGNRVYKRFWGESDMSSALGYEDTLGKDKSYDQAYKHFTKELGLSHEETIERLTQLGYEENLPGDKIRIVENPRKFIEEYLENLLSKKTPQSDIVQNDQDEEEEKEINPIILKQIRSLKNTLNNNNLSIIDVLKYLKNNE